MAEQFGGVPMLEATAGTVRPAGRHGPLADLAAIGSALHWRPMVPLEMSVRDMRQAVQPWLGAAGGPTARH
jgi:hypothetical protein